MGRTVDQPCRTRKREGTQVGRKGEVEHDLAWVSLDRGAYPCQRCQLCGIRGHSGARVEHLHCIHCELPRLTLPVIA